MREINLALALAGIGAERRPPFQEGGAGGEGGGVEGIAGSGRSALICNRSASLWIRAALIEFMAFSFVKVAAFHS